MVMINRKAMKRRENERCNRIIKLHRMAPQWIKACIKYWETRICESDLGVDFADAGAMCWRCARLRRHGKESRGVVLEKCHIIPKSRGGTNGPDNIIPLCRACHDEMPNVSNSRAVWDWIKEEHAIFYGGSYCSEKALAIAESKGFDMSRFSFEKYEKLRQQSANHFGGQNVNTIVWCLLEACRPDQQAPQAEQVQP